MEGEHLTNQVTPWSVTIAHALLSKETNLVLKGEFLLVAILTKIQKHHVLIRLELPLLLLLKFPLLLLVQIDHNPIITTKTPIDVALGASGHNSNTATTTDISKHLVVDLFFPKKWHKNEHVGSSLQNKSTSHSANDEVPNISKQTVVDISSPQGQHTDNKGTHMITKSKLKNDPNLKS